MAFADAKSPGLGSTGPYFHKARRTPRSRCLQTITPDFGFVGMLLGSTTRELTGMVTDYRIAWSWTLHPYPTSSPQAFHCGFYVVFFVPIMRPAPTVVRAASAWPPKARPPTPEPPPHWPRDRVSCGAAAQDCVPRASIRTRREMLGCEARGLPSFRMPLLEEAATRMRRSCRKRTTPPWRAQPCR